MRLDSRLAFGCDALAVTKIMEGLVYGVEEVVDVLLQDTRLAVIGCRDVVLNEVGVRGAEL